MRAVVKDAPEPGVALSKVPDPRPATGELLLDVRTVGICGSDLHAYEWIPEYAWLRPHLPRVLGHEIVGQVVATPPNSAFAAGDVVAARPRVECGRCRPCSSEFPQHCERRTRLGFERDGGLAERVCVPERNAYRIPPGVNDDSAALLEPLAVAVHAIGRTTVRPGSTAAVIGAGAIGLLAAQVLRAVGAGRVLVLGIEADEVGGGLAVAESFGASTARADTDTPAEHLGGFEVVCVAAGAPQAMTTAMQLAAPGAQVVVVGLGIGAWEWNVDSWVRGENTIVGAHGAAPSDWLRARDLIATRGVTGSGIVSHRYGLGRTPQAFEAMAAGAARKVLIYPNGGEPSATDGS